MRLLVPLCLLVLTLALLAGCCRVTRVPAAPPPPRPLAVEARFLLDRLDHGSEEERYGAARGLARHPHPVVRRRLRRLLEHEHALTRNAAARSLVEIGEPYAARVLIQNLHREERTYVVTDAIHHLEQLFGTTRGYEPNLGYRHQTERQARWWAWWETQGRRRPLPKADADENEADREALALGLRGFEAATFTSDRTQWASAKWLWVQASALAPSRHLADVALIAKVFTVLADRYPDHAYLLNNHALAALNDGRWRAAERAYEQALRLETDDAQLHNDQGILLEGLGHLEAAEAAYRRATELAKKDDVPWSNLGDVLAKRGLTAAAIQAYRQAERLAPDKWYYHRLWIRRLAPAAGVRVRSG